MNNQLWHPYRKKVTNNTWECDIQQVQVWQIMLESVTNNKYKTTGYCTCTVLMTYWVVRHLVVKSLGHFGLKLSKMSFKRAKVKVTQNLNKWLEYDWNKPTKVSSYPIFFKIESSSTQCQFIHDWRFTNIFDLYINQEHIFVPEEYNMTTKTWSRRYMWP